MTNQRRCARLGAVLLTLGLSTLVLLPGTSGASTAAAPASKTPIKHLVFLLQANHSFDNYFGVRASVDGLPKAACQPVRAKSATPCTRPFHLTSQVQTDTLRDSAQTFLDQYAGGKMDGFVSAYTATGRSGRVAMGYYNRGDLPYYYQLADQYVLFDKFFSSAMSGSVANHMFAVAGQPGTATARGSIPPAGWGNIPTIFDRLQASGINWKYYVQNYDSSVTYRTLRRQNTDKAAQAIRVPLLAFSRFLDDPRLRGHVVDLNEYYADLAAGKLPAVSYIASSADSEHPPGGVRAGQRLSSSLIGGLQKSSAWSSSAFLLAYDSAGGWYDHVRPPQVDRQGYGFRVPALLVSPYARQGHVDSSTLDFTSVLRFIEDNWSLPSLSTRDAKATSIAGAFDFTQPPRRPVLAVAGKSGGGVRVGVIYGLYGFAAVVGLGLVGGIALMRGRGVSDRWRSLVAVSRVGRS